MYALLVLYALHACLTRIPCTYVLYVSLIHTRGCKPYMYAFCIICTGVSARDLLHLPCHITSHTHTHTHTHTHIVHMCVYVCVYIHIMYIYAFIYVYIYIYIFALILDTYAQVFRHVLYRISFVKCKFAYKPYI